jgi:hypothetical protein
VRRETQFTLNTLRARSAAGVSALGGGRAPGSMGRTGAIDCIWTQRGSRLRVAARGPLALVSHWDGPSTALPAASAPKRRLPSCSSANAGIATESTRLARECERLVPRIQRMRTRVRWMPARVRETRDVMGATGAQLRCARECATRPRTRVRWMPARVRETRDVMGATGAQLQRMRTRVRHTAARVRGTRTRMRATRARVVVTRTAIRRTRA